jgi:hypothetical protein
MRTTFPPLAIIPVILLIALGFLLFVSPPFGEKTVQQNGGSGSDSYVLQDSAERFQASDNAGLNFNLNDYGQMDLNDVAVYSGIISKISVSPTIVTYDYNHDGIADVKKTVLFFNIG